MANRPEPGMQETAFIVDDDEGMREALSCLMHSVGINPVVYPNGVAFLDAFTPDLQGCVVTDLRMPGLSGLALMERLASRGNRLPVIVLSGYGTIPLAVKAVQDGAFDFVEKPFDEQALIDRVQAAIEKDRRNRAQLLERAELDRKLQQLTPREKVVMEYVVNGWMNKQIAHKLHVCLNTVEVHRANLMRKLGINSVIELTRLALAAGMISADPTDFGHR